VLQACADADTSQYLQFGSQGDAVRLLQEALIDLGYSIPDGPTGGFFQQTSDAVVQFKTDQQLTPNDPVAGTGTVTALDALWSMPFADRDEFLSWQTRPIPEFNFTRANRLQALQSGTAFSFGPDSWLQAGYQDAFLTGLTGLLDPQGSPNGALTPSATWGASPLDLYHCHLVFDRSLALDPGWSSLRNRGISLNARLDKLKAQALQSGQPGTPEWTAAYRQMLFAPAADGGPSIRDSAVALYDDALAMSVSTQQGLWFLWHTFEGSVWRPVEVGDNDARRSWWNEISPAAGPVTATPFTPSTFGQNVVDILEPNFLVDQNGVITVVNETQFELCAVTGLDKRRIDSAPFP